MLLTSAAIGPFRSINSTQTVDIHPKVTVFVGMNEAGKTVLLKALHKSVDALDEEEFDPVEDYPRKDLSGYLKIHDTKPAAATVLTYAITAEEAITVNKKVGTSLSAGFQFEVAHSYANGLIVTLSVDEAPIVKTLAKTFGVNATKALKDCKSIRSIPAILSKVELTDSDNAILTKVNQRITAAKWENVIQWEVWQALPIPKFLYFSDYDVLPGKLNLTDLSTRIEQAKTEPKHLQSKHRAVLALLRMADISVADLAKPGGYEELKAKIEAVSISLTDQVMEFWKQNEDLEVEVDIKTDSTDEAPFNNGPNLYLRIKNRRHRGVSTPFDQRSRGFIWFFSFLVWFDSVQYQIDPSGKSVGRKLILLLDEPGLALHALAQADFLRYIDRLAEDHQVLYTTHSPFMVHADRLNQVRLVEDQAKLGTVISSNLNGSDPRTIFPLQAALGWTIAQNLFISERNLLVEGPSELVYLQLVSTILENGGGEGMRGDVTTVPTGSLDNVATFVALLGANGLKLAVLHDYRGKSEQRLDGLIQQKLLNAKHVFNVSQFRDVSNLGVNGKPSDIEDMFPVDMYLQYFCATFKKKLSGAAITETDLPPGDRIVERLTRYLKDKGIVLKAAGGYNHYAVANNFAVSPPKSLDADTAARFKSLFKAVNASY